MAEKSRKMKVRELATGPGAMESSGDSNQGCLKRQVSLVRMKKCSQHP